MRVKNALVMRIGGMTMATDGPTPKPCNEGIFKNGVQVFITHSIPSNAMDRLYVLYNKEI